MASILAYVYQLERGVNTALQEPEIPSDFIFDELESLLRSKKLRRRKSSIGQLISTLVFLSNVHLAS